MTATPVPVRQNLSQRLKENTKFRRSFFRSRTRNTIASQLRQLRKLRNMRQSDLEAKSQMQQSAISRIEQADYSSWTYNTLLRVTEALDGVLDVNIRPVEELIDQYAVEEKMEEAQFRKEAAGEMLSALLETQPAKTGHVLIAETGRFIVRGGASEVKISLEEAAKAQPKPKPSNISKVVTAPVQQEPGLSLGQIAANQELAEVA